MNIKYISSACMYIHIVYIKTHPIVNILYFFHIYVYYKHRIQKLSSQPLLNCYSSGDTMERHRPEAAHLYLQILVAKENTLILEIPIFKIIQWSICCKQIYRQAFRQTMRMNSTYPFWFELDAPKSFIYHGVHQSQSIWCKTFVSKPLLS